MRRRTVVKAKAKKTGKKVGYELIPRTTDYGKAMYRRLDELIEAHHEELSDARIAIAWCTSWRPDVDGRVILGKCKKASDLDRELAAFDFIILISKWWWQDLEVTDDMRRALMDHELTHATVALDPRTLEPARDERGRKVYRMRKHDLEEFSSVVERWGTYKKDLELFAAALRRNALAGFKPCAACRDSSHPGYTSEDDGRTLKRCACWDAWQNRATAAA